ncbi:hypothetical protein ACTXT7_005399 [Hymenolepis weldensis]
MKNSPAADFVYCVAREGSYRVGPNLDSGKGYGVATPPGSDLRDRLNLAVLELKEMDWIAQLYRTWWEERGECGKASTSTDINSATSSLGLDSVYGLFYLLAGALVIGIALSILEFIYRCAVEAKRSRVAFSAHNFTVLAKKSPKIQSLLLQLGHGVYNAAQTFILKSNSSLFGSSNYFQSYVG